MTEFLDPALAADARVVIDRMADCEARPWVGYDRAERVRLVIGRREVLDGDDDDSFAALTDASNGCVALLQVSGNFMFDAADHRDFLGAALGAGIERDRLGDILVQGERGRAGHARARRARHGQKHADRGARAPRPARASDAAAAAAPLPRELGSATCDLADAYHAKTFALFLLDRL